MKKKIAVALGLALIVAVIIGAVIKSNNDSMVEVKTAEVEKMEYEDKVLATGTVEVVDSAEVASSLPSKLTLKVQEGDRVEKGQVLAELDVSEQKQQLKEAEDALQKAEDGLQKAEANLANARKGREEAAAAVKNAGTMLAEAKQNLDAVKSLFQEKKATQEQLDVAQQAYDEAEKAQKAASSVEVPDPASLALGVEQAKAQVDAARSAVKAARSAVEKGKLTAPIDGVVLQIAATDSSGLIYEGAAGSLMIWSQASSIRSHCPSVTPITAPWRALTPLILLTIFSRMPSCVARASTGTSSVIKARGPCFSSPAA